MDPTRLTRFSPDLPTRLPASEERRLRAEIEALSPWLQGPFYLGGDVIIEGLWRSDEVWSALDDYLPDVRGKRVLDVGANAGYDSFMFQSRGAREVVACEPFAFIAQARFLESIYQSGTRFLNVAWQNLHPDLHGAFDLVYCNGLLYHEPEPLGLLLALNRMLAPGGQLVLGSMMLAEAELSEYTRFVPADYAGDPTWWWVPGRLALRWLIESCGMEAEVLPIRLSGPPGEFEVVHGYLRCRGGHASPLSSDQFSPPERPVAESERLDEPANRFPIGHYYSPMYDSRQLETQADRLWPTSPRETVGIAWRADEQVGLCEIFRRQEQFRFVEAPTADPTVYYGANDQYPPLDAWVLSGLLQHARPARMVEVGSGFSTLVSARTNRERLDMSMQLTCIEPYPRDFLLSGVLGVGELRVEKVQDTPLEVFSALRSGDVLFIDTSHTVKTGGDVNWLFEEIIPRVAPGVLVHVHDVFLPGDYPQSWVMEGWGWNESYLVRAFLEFNAAFEIMWGAQYMLTHHLALLHETFSELHTYTPSGGSLWMRRVS